MTSPFLDFVTAFTNKESELAKRIVLRFDDPREFLLEAANNGRLDLVRFLVEECGVSPDIWFKSDGRPESNVYVLTRQYYDVALYLVEKGARYDGVNFFKERGLPREGAIKYLKLLAI